MKLKEEDLYLLRSLTVNYVNHLDRNIKTQERQGTPERLQEPFMDLQGHKINYLQYRDRVIRFLNRLHYTCKNKKLLVENPQVDSLIQALGDKVLIPASLKEVKSLKKQGLELYKDNLDFYIRTYTFWKTEIIPKDQWDTQLPNYENAFGQSLTSEQVLFKAKAKLAELEEEFKKLSA